MVLDLGNFEGHENSRKAPARTSIGGNPLITRRDFDTLNLNDMEAGEQFSGKVQVARVLEKNDKSYNTAIIEVFNSEDNEKLTLFVNFDSRNENISVNDSFDFYIDFFNLFKSLACMNDSSNKNKVSFTNVNTLKVLEALDSLDTVIVTAIEKENGYNTFVLSVDNYDFMDE